MCDKVQSKTGVCKKVSFSDEQQAIYYIEKLRKTSKRPSIPQRAYLCEKCFNWHLTSKQEGKTYEFLLKENENLKKEIEEKKKLISECSIRIDAVQKSVNSKLSESNKIINQLENKLKRKEKLLNHLYKLIEPALEKK